MIVVIGLGETGRPLFELIKEAGLNVKGVDVEPVEITEPVEIIHVCLRPDDPDWFVTTVKQYSEKYDPEIICINSTVLPGTSKKVQEATGKPVVFSPIRGMHHKNMLEDIKFYTKYIGSDNLEWAQKVAEHFQKIGLKTKVLDSFSKTEWLKPLSTSYYGVLIGWAQEVLKLSKEHGFEYNDFCEWNKEIEARGISRPKMFPGYIGGHCVMPNIKLLKKIIQSDYLDAIGKSNEWIKKNFGENYKGD